MVLTNRQTEKIYENNGHLAVNQKNTGVVYYWSTRLLATALVTLSLLTRVRLVKQYRRRLYRLIWAMSW